MGKIPNGVPVDRGFTLVDEPWIRVKTSHGAMTEMSLRSVFQHADEVREISGELPTQDFAILRLLLAILYRAIADEVIPDRWDAWWTDGLPTERIEAYLDRLSDRFDLFDPGRPFFQVADLQLGNESLMKAKSRDVGPIIFDLPTRNRLFTSRAGTGTRTLTLAESARWVVNAQAFDPSGIKSGALGDARVSGGKGAPIGVGWSGLLGGVYASGRTLRETLLLNLVGTHEGFTLHPDDDLPPWEDPDADTASERLGLVPRGPVRLYTWQSRRIRLFREDDRVVGCLVANGDKLTPQNMQDREPLSGWRYSEPQTSKAKQTTYMPREHIAGRALWRGINALLPGIAEPVQKKDVPAAIAPALVGWLEVLRQEGYLDETERVLLRSVGVVYGSNNSVVDEVISDELILPVALLNENNRALALEAQSAVRLAEEGARIVRQLAENLSRAAGGDGEGSGVRARDRAYALLDAPYRHWLRELKDDTDPLDAITEWKRTARRVLEDLGDELADRAGPSAWIGREVSRLGTSTLITTSRAEGWFRAALTKTFGVAAGKDQAA